MSTEHVAPDEYDAATPSTSKKSDDKNVDTEGRIPKVAVAKSTQPLVGDMIKNAIQKMVDRQGASKQEIDRYINDTFELDGVAAQQAVHLISALQRAIEPSTEIGNSSSVSEKMKKKDDDATTKKKKKLVNEKTFSANMDGSSTPKKYKLGRNAAETARKINENWGKGSVNECTVQRWFQKFRSGNISLEDEPHGSRPPVIDNDQLKRLVEGNPCLTVQALAEELNVHPSTVSRHLKQIGKSK